MSFPKAKRFLEVKDTTPAPDQYNVSASAKPQGVALPTTERFMEPKDLAPKSLNNTLLFMSPLRKVASTESLPPSGSTQTKRRVSRSQDDRRLKELESEVQRLVKYQAYLDRQRQQEKDEVTRLEGNLQRTLKEKSELQATLAKTEKQLLDTTKARDTLKAKLEGIEISQKRHDGQQNKEMHLLQDQLQSKTEELQRLETQMGCKVKSLEVDIISLKSQIQ
ncbi:hyaluronan mediated motility receptor-like isoform X1 [Apostichopus japonicus]|uniref:hyaluronan mediated motility receptor-like isoform X1 n=1 Tax=Stichopus japonicus TaxID=307972 RepID=UPI003AB88CCE